MPLAASRVRCCPLLKIISYSILIITMLQVPTKTTTTVHCNQVKTTTRLKIPANHELKLNHLPQRFSRPPPPAQQAGTQYLPTGPPPYRPSQSVITLAKKLGGGGGQLIKFKAINLQLQQRKIYDTFLDVVRNLGRLADQLASGRIKLTGAKLKLIQRALGEVALFGGKSLKLKWPLVMLNPHFLRELLANPTFLVMLFHAIEVGYASSPLANVWLKPLVKLVKQPSGEKEEQTWWRRKRLYETFNGIGSSELQPNLKTVHFRRPGRPIQVSLPMLKQLLPNFYDKKLLEQPKQLSPVAHLTNLISSDHENNHLTELLDLSEVPISEQQLLSQEEFEALEESDRQRILREAKQNLEESLWTNELIQQQNSLVESLVVDRRQNSFVDDSEKGDESSQGPQRQTKNTQHRLLYRDRR